MTLSRTGYLLNNMSYFWFYWDGLPRSDSMLLYRVQGARTNRYLNCCMVRENKGHHGGEEKQKFEAVPRLDEKLERDTMHEVRN